MSDIKKGALVKAWDEEEILHELALEQLEELKRVGVVDDLTIQDVIDFATCDNHMDSLELRIRLDWLGSMRFLDYMDGLAMALLIKQIKGEVIG